MNGENKVRSSKEKIKNPDSLVEALEKEREKGRMIVFTNGCFDIIHPGHVQYLEDARNCGDLLVVGLNSDDSVKRLKGPERPLNRQEDRAAQLAGLESIDFITFFSEDTPLELIKKVRPNVLVKGGDWPVEKIVGSDFVFAGGGNVYSLPFLEGYSTTSLVERIKSLGIKDL